MCRGWSPAPGGSWALSDVSWGQPQGAGAAQVWAAQTSDTWATLAENFLEPVPCWRHVCTLTSQVANQRAVLYVISQSEVSSNPQPYTSIIPFALHSWRNGGVNDCVWDWTKMRTSVLLLRYGEATGGGSTVIRCCEGKWRRCWVWLESSWHHDKQEISELLFTYISCLFRFWGRRSDISCQHPTINIPQRMRSLGVTKQSKDNWD